MEEAEEEEATPRALAGTLATLLGRMDVRTKYSLEALWRKVSAPAPLTREEIQLGKRREMRVEKTQRTDETRGFDS